MAQESKNLEDIRCLKLQPGNKKCAECKSPSLYVVAKYGYIFVCHNCAGIHRCFISGRYVKGLTTANFSLDDVRAMKEGGNVVSSRYWMHAFKGSLPDPTSSMSELKKFVEMKYIKRAWIASEEENYTINTTTSSTASSSSKILSNVATSTPTEKVTSQTSTFEKQSTQKTQLQPNCNSAQPLISVERNKPSEVDFFAGWNRNIPKSEAPLAEKKLKHAQVSTPTSSPPTRPAIPTPTKHISHTTTIIKSTKQSTDLLDFSWFDELEVDFCTKNARISTTVAYM